MKHRQLVYDAMSRYVPGKQRTDPEMTDVSFV